MIFSYPIFYSESAAFDEHKARIIKIFQDFKGENGEYPTSHQINQLSREPLNRGILPNVRSMQIRSGGIIRFCNEVLGIPYVDARMGGRRGTIALEANLQSQDQESSLAKVLAKKFGLRNVHLQSPYGGTLHRADFKVFDEDNKFFFIDVFTPSGIYSLSGCVSSKLRRLAKTTVSLKTPIYFVAAGNISDSDVENLKMGKKKTFPKNIHLMTLKTFLNRLDSMV